MGYDESWELDTGGYSKDKFYTKATDGRGHSEIVYLKMPPNILSAASEIVQKGRTPYRTVQDFLRDAAVHRLHDLRTMGLAEGMAGTLFEFEEYAQELHRQHKRMEAFEQIIRDTEEWVRKLGWDNEEAKEMVRRLYAKALAIQDSEYWRKRYVEEIERKFKPLLED